MILNMQGGYIKYGCILCDWIATTEIPIKKKKKKIWPQRKWKVGEKIYRMILVVNEDVLLPPLHIKLGLIKQFVMTMNPSGRGVYVCFKIVSSSFGIKNKGGCVCGSPN